MTEESVGKAVELVLSREQKFAKWAFGALVGYFASELAEKGYEIALAAYRRRKSN